MEIGKQLKEARIKSSYQEMVSEKINVSRPTISNGKMRSLILIFKHYRTN